MLRKWYAGPLLLGVTSGCLPDDTMYTMTSICPSGPTAFEDEIVDSDLKKRIDSPWKMFLFKTSLNVIFRSLVSSGSSIPIVWNEEVHP